MSAFPQRIDQGGTGKTIKTEAFDALSPSTTKGDITVYDGSDNIRLAVGADGQALLSDSGEASGLKWGAGGGDMLASVYDPAAIAEQLVGLTATQTLTNKTLTTPTIGDFTNATHNHQTAAGGGTLDTAAIVSGTFADARISQSSVTQHVAAIDHDALLNFAANEHFTEASIDHGSIAGLADDDHTQYIRVDGTRAFTGNQSFGDFNITNVGDISLDTISSDAGTFVNFSDGLLYVNETANTFMTTGITINQGTADNEIFAMKSSDVNHGMTDETETDTYALFRKSSGPNGGVNIDSYSDGTAAVRFRGNESIENTNNTSSALGAILLDGRFKSGTTAGSKGATSNIVAIRNNTTTTHIFKGNGGFYQVGAGSHFINESTNGNMTTGVTINQGAADDEILSFKSSDVAHGITGQTETDTYALFRKDSATSGGVKIQGFSEDISCFRMAGAATNGDTAKTTGANGNLIMQLQKKSGTGVTTHATNENLVVIKNSGTTRWILDADGDIFYGGADDGTITDDYDDVQLLEGFRAVMSPKDSPAHKRFKGFVDDSEDVLVQQGVLTAKLRDGGLVSDTGLKGLMIDGMRQMYLRIQSLEQKLSLLQGV